MDHLQGEDGHGEFNGLKPVIGGEADEEEHHDAIEFATRLTTCPRSALEGALLAAVVRLDLAET
eukprot:SAG11_NODE_1642_length_4529_cov_2.274944_7_plen_64_part_00